MEYTIINRGKIANPTVTHILPTDEDPKAYVRRNIAQYNAWDTVRVITPNQDRYFEVTRKD